MTFIKKRPFAVGAAIGEGGALLLTALMCLPAAWLVTREMVPEALGGACAAVAAGLAVLLSTAVIARCRGRQALATGGAIAGGYVLLAALGCALSGDRGAFGPWLAAVSAAVCAGGLGGALLSVRQNRHKKRKR